MKIKAISSWNKKLCAILLTMLMLVGSLPFTSVAVADAANARQKVVDYMRSMATIKWKPKSTISYWSNPDLPESKRRYFTAGTTYTGMPYTQNTRVNLSGFKKWINSNGVYTGSTTSAGYAGNDCSWAVVSAWKQVSKTVTSTYTGNMFPGKNGIVAVGSYSSSASSSNTKTITRESGQSTMYAAYAKLQPGDAIMARVKNVVNHTRLVVSVSSNSVKVIEQSGLRTSEKTSWYVDKTYTFSELYSKYYIPITVKELQGVSASKPTGPSQLKISSYNTPTNLGLGKSFSIYGTITSNYDIKSVTVGIYDANGKSVSSKTVKPNSTYYSLSSIDNYIKFANAKAGTNYYKVSATDQKTTKQLVNKKYTVGSSSSSGGKSAASTLSISSYNYPTTLGLGKSFTIGGTVSSNYKITSLTVGIYNASGAAVSTKTVKPKAKSYSIKNVDSYIKFGAAKAGTNYYKITATDEKTTKTLLNKAYTVTGGSSSTVASTLAISGYNYPSGTLTQGKSFTIKGKIKSNYKIKSVTVGIYNASGAGVSTKTVNPNAKSYNIANIDAYIKFGSAKAGTNYYKITATDEKVTKTLVNKSYTVKSNDPASTLKATNCNYPTTIEEGKSYTIKGTITSNYKITSVTVGIYNASGKAVSAKTVNPNAKSYSISSIDKYIKFGAAKAGTNYYKIVASDTKKTATLLNQKYTVKAKQAAASTLALSNYTAPSSLNVGQSFTIKGSITSNYTITKVTVGVYNSNGGAVSTRSVTPNSKSFNIATIDNYIKFGQAKAGTNYYKIVATDQKITKTLLNKAYTVKTNNVASTLTITGHNVPPAQLAQGKSFTIKGTVSSNYNITSLTVGIYNSNGGAVSVKTVAPNAKSYSISKVDSYIKFGQAKPGKNYYKIKATDSKQTKTLVNSAYNVKGSTAASSLSISGHNVPPSKMKLGKSLSIYGTVSSNYNITSLTVGIYTEKGSPVSTKKVSPNAKSYSISKIDAYIKFGAAGKGVHYYKIVATDSKQTKTLVNSKYKVVSSDTSAPTKPSGKGADDIVAVAKTQIGTSGRPNKYTYWYGKVEGSYSYAWCATFTSWCANQAGISKSVIPPECSCGRMVNEFKKLGSGIIKDPSKYDPVKGDIIFFDNAKVGGSYNHVGIVVSYNKSTGAITTIEGNTSNESNGNGNTVAKRTRYKNTSGFKVSAFAHPKYPAAKSSSSSKSSSKSSSDSSKPSGKTISAAQAKKIAGDITASYEGGYTAVAGNSDGQGISVGFFQWNIGKGTLQPLLKKFLNNHTSEAKKIFGNDKYNGLKTMLNKSSKSEQLAWVKKNIIQSNGKTIKDGWYTCLKNMCKTESFQAIEVDAAESYFNQGKALFKKYKLTTLRSYCLCVDIAVQNWDPSKYMGSTAGKSEKQIQKMLVEAAVAKSKPAYKDDVRARKSTIANGSGKVHGKTYNMQKEFGLTDQVITW